jgi:hypothetical protein
LSARRQGTLLNKADKVTSGEMSLSIGLHRTLLNKAEEVVGGELSLSLVRITSDIISGDRVNFEKCPFPKMRTVPGVML